MFFSKKRLPALKRKDLFIIIAALALVSGVVVWVGAWDRRAENRAPKTAVLDDSFRAAVTQASERVAEEDYSGAIAVLEASLPAADTASEKYETLLLIGDYRMALEDYEKAYASYLEAEKLAEDKDDPRLLEAIALSAESRGEEAVAITYYEKLLAVLEAGGAGDEEMQALIADIKHNLEHLKGEVEPNHEH